MGIQTVKGHERKMKSPREERGAEGREEDNKTILP